MYTRKQYMGGACSHRDYYAQFVTEYILRMVRDVIGMDTLKASRDEHFNDIQLHRWDHLSEALKGSLAIANEYGDGKKYYSLGNGVCILKEAARQLLEGATV